MEIVRTELVELKIEEATATCQRGIEGPLVVQPPGQPA